MWYALAVVGGLLVGWLIGAIRGSLSEYRLIVEMGRTFGIETSPDWSPERRKALIFKVLVRVGLNHKMRETVAAAQAEAIKNFARMG